MSSVFGALPEKTKRLFAFSSKMERRLGPWFDPETGRRRRASGNARRGEVSAAAGQNPVTASQALVQRVRAERLAKGWTQKQLAERAGMKRANIARLEAGRHTPTVDTVELLANALSMSVSDLFEASIATSEQQTLNARRLMEGRNTLRAALRGMREKGIIDAKGKRLARELPAEMREGTSDAV